MNTIKQTVIQYNLDGVPERMIIQYTNESGEDEQVIVSYADLKVSEKSVFNSFKTLCTSKMP